MRFDSGRGAGKGWKLQITGIPNMEFFNDVGSDAHRPSLFELIAQEQLRDLLQPALKYVLAVSSLKCFTFVAESNQHRAGICTAAPAVSPSGCQ
jgi:hypothetical protein